MSGLPRISSVDLADFRRLSIGLHCGGRRVFPGGGGKPLSSSQSRTMASSCAMLDSVDRERVEKATHLHPTPTEASTYLAQDEKTGKFVWKASRYAHRFISREATAVFKQNDIDGIVEDKTWEIPDGEWV